MSNKAKFGLGFILSLIIVLVLVAWILFRPSPISQEQTIEPCDKVLAGQWSNYQYKDKFRIDIPRNWSYKEHGQTGEVDSVSWLVSFGPDELNLDVKIASAVSDYQQLKDNLEKLEDQNFEIIEEKLSYLSGRETNTILLRSKNGVEYHVFHLSFTSGDYLLLGPANKDQFDGCQVQLFDKMKDTFILEDAIVE